MSRFRRALQAWHGSPHDYDEFKDEAIGSGEGAQVYGHGHYVAEARPVAEQYRDQLTQVRKSLNENPHWTYKGTPVSDIVKVYPHGPGAPEWSVEQRALGALSNYDVYTKPRGFQTALKKMRETAKFFADRYSPSHGEAVKHSSIADWMEDNKHHFRYNKNPEGRDLGRLYEVHVALGDDEILDWDQPIREHHDDVKKKLQPLFDQMWHAHGGVEDYKDYNMSSQSHGGRGLDIYGSLKSHHKSASAATKALLNAGIRGIRYRDAGSRAPSTDLYLDGEKIPAREWGNETHAHRAALDGDWDRASMLAGLPSLKEGRIKTLEDLKKSITANHGYRTLPAENNLPGWFEENKHRVQLKPSRGTYNYVVFDPKDIRIVRKYGLKNQLIKDFGTEPVHLTNVEGDHQHG